MNCTKCGVLNENYKDYESPVFLMIYTALSMADEQKEVDGKITEWLNVNGFANMTCCPVCHVDDFTHVEGCRLSEHLEQFEIRVFPRGTK